jgi:hypothetical protein
MSRPARTSLDPRAFEFGAVAAQHATVDQLFVMIGPDATAMILDALVDRLPEPERSVILCFSSGMSNAETGRLLGADPEFLSATGRQAGPIARRTVHRWQVRGAERLGVWMTRTSWMHALLDGRLPTDIFVGGERDDGDNQQEAAS